MLHGIIVLLDHQPFIRLSKASTLYSLSKATNFGRSVTGSDFIHDDGQEIFDTTDRDQDKLQRFFMKT